MDSPTIRLGKLGIVLPALPSPAGNYVHAVRSGRLLFLAGKGVGSYSGKVGREVTVEQAYEYARSTGIMLLSVIASELGSLDRVFRIIKLTGFVNATQEFTEHPKVINGCLGFACRGIWRARQARPDGRWCGFYAKPDTS